MMKWYLNTEWNKNEGKKNKTLPTALNNWVVEQGQMSANPIFNREPPKYYHYMTYAFKLASIHCGKGERVKYPFFIKSGNTSGQQL